jgi:hypothetical protein
MVSHVSAMCEASKTEGFEELRYNERTGCETLIKDSSLALEPILLGINKAVSQETEKPKLPASSLLTLYESFMYWMMMGWCLKDSLEA